MPLSISCTGCGSKLTVRDELLGKRIKCPKCGAGFTAAEAASATKMRENSGTLSHRVHISPGMIAMICAIILIPGGLMFWKLGPGKTRAEFYTMLPKMDDTVKDVVDRALEAYDSQNAHFNPLKPHLAPHTHDVNYKLGYMPVSMPAKIPFAGLTTEGVMVGRYTVATGEVEADVEIGGQAQPGLLVRHGSTVIKVAGRMDGGNVVATINGQPAVVQYPPTREEIEAKLETLKKSHR